MADPVVPASSPEPPTGNPNICGICHAHISDVEQHFRWHRTLSISPERLKAILDAEFGKVKQ